MKIVKPNTLALLYRTLRFEGVDRLSIGALALFPLRADAPVGPDDLATETELWQVAQQMFDEHALLDEGFPKPAGEFLVYGNVYAPACERGARTSIAVRARIGATCKERLVDVRASAPLADFRALLASDRERVRHLGPLDARWQANHWPHLPPGTRAEYFHAAPRDQRIAGFWRGGESIELVNMHADRPIIAGALPRLRARCFVERMVGGVARVDTCPMRAETVWLFPGAVCGIILYRALAAIDDEDGDDVVRVIAGWECADAPPLADDAYIGQPMIEDRRPLANAAALAESVDDEARANTGPDVDRMAAVSASHTKPPVLDLSELERDAAALAVQTDALLAEHGLTEADITRLLPARVAPTDLNLDELAALAAELNAQTEQWQTQCCASAVAGVQNATPPSSSSPWSPESDDAPLVKLLRQADAQARALVEQLGLSRAQVQAAAHDRPELAALVDALDAPLDLGALTTGLAAPGNREAIAPDALVAPEQPPANQLDDAALALPAASQISGAAPAPPLTRELVIERHAHGLGFAGLDLSDLDLSSAALEHADFRDAHLERTCFAGCKLSGASFERALMSHADFSNADLSETTLVQASAPDASFRGATLDRARLDRTDFTNCDFTRASLVDSRCVGAQFDASAMSALTAARLDGAHASFAGCTLDAADFTSARLPRANFQHATLTDATFASAQCDGVEWHAAQAPHARFHAASLRGSRADAATSFRQANLSRASLDDANWDGADLSHANLHKATLDRASLVHAIASGTQLTLTSARHADLAKADLSHADMRFSNLFGTSLRRTRLNGAQLQSSNLYGADCYGTALSRSQFDGANVYRTLLDVPVHLLTEIARRSI
ncbi:MULTISPECIES: type VI secretion system accessory protein TagAB-5 [Burkholderia]|uniref:type VI secretion system accessory protein TagAB-5 n=1 Tax=Burkholderia TaxID=32008 RepID=UPI00075C85FA|nr:MULTISPECIES: pentapeptide repeat-containing protein [Burkholderia]AOJ73477.1 hypothetical protein WS78_31985 [Burkholderia savannae]KVG41381.1 hypothetical protein WS77_17205 [Burkholderia sp. MSMB0265]KVG87900.1 hypothetical protein WS81_25540 [Burkholderia sp. MSMB2040]KVG96471.1 hypothetical protein WS82_32040 [Burkholderia sp. MSMB2041]KVH01618.1 hypothetical protein WS83_18095 [Burkholderia sp. MSMB2042]